MSNPTPIIKGFRIIPLLLNAKETAQGSSSHASIPSVIKTITFLQSSQSGKSVAAYSNDLAIGVVPFGTRPLILFLILS